MDPTNRAGLPFENPLAAMGGGYYGMLAKPGAAPGSLRPQGQEGPMPPGPARNHYVDQVENGRAKLLDDKGRAMDVPADPGMHEGRMENGSQPTDEGYDLRMKLGRGDDGRDIDLNAPMPKVPLAPGSPGPPIPPAADSMIGQKKSSSQTKRRRIP